jgi:hypothetical protein
MHETDAVLELKRRVADAGGSLAFELFEYTRAVLLVFGGEFGFDSISHHQPFHDCLLDSTSSGHLMFHFRWLLLLRRSTPAKGCGALGFFNWLPVSPLQVSVLLPS